MNIAVTGVMVFLEINLFILIKKNRKIICFPSKVKKKINFIRMKKFNKFFKIKKINVLIHFAGIRKKESEESKKMQKFNF